MSFICISVRTKNLGKPVLKKDIHVVDLVPYNEGKISVPLIACCSLLNNLHVLIF